MSDEFDAQVASVAALGEPIRRGLYQYVVAQEGPVGREQAAAGTGVALHVAKFHLDKLVADGLLEADYSRPPGRGGPGAGRPAKLYRRSSRHIAVSLPERRYDLAGRVMAEAITAATRQGIPVADALRAAARTVGRSLGVPGDQPAEVLARHGYEPRTTGDAVVLANCPFHALAERYTELVCGMNLDLINGLLDALGPGERRARLDPAPGRCCVTIA